ncbi:hypothetical protein HDU67_003231 [Dinochytrium kinnereticum]|nr:hypothetical protein HDU67_003231 [Dinochytrium kinnereticum]
MEHCPPSTTTVPLYCDASSAPAHPVYYDPVLQQYVVYASQQPTTAATPQPAMMYMVSHDAYASAAVTEGALDASVFASAPLEILDIPLENDIISSALLMASGAPVVEHGNEVTAASIAMLDSMIAQMDSEVGENAAKCNNDLSLDPFDPFYQAHINTTSSTTSTPSWLPPTHIRNSPNFASSFPSPAPTLASTVSGSTIFSPIVDTHMPSANVTSTPFQVFDSPMATPSMGFYGTSQFDEVSVVLGSPVGFSAFNPQQQQQSTGLTIPIASSTPMMLSPIIQVVPAVETASPMPQTPSNWSALHPTTILLSPAAMESPLLPTAPNHWSGSNMGSPASIMGSPLSFQETVGLMGSQQVASGAFGGYVDNGLLQQQSQGVSMISAYHQAGPTVTAFPSYLQHPSAPVMTPAYQPQPSNVNSLFQLPSFPFTTATTSTSLLPPTYPTPNEPINATDENRSKSVPTSETDSIASSLSTPPPSPPNPSSTKTSLNPPTAPPPQITSSSSKPPPRAPGIHKCPISTCTRTFATLDRLRSHQRTHRRIRQHPCGWAGCDKSFFTRQDVERHMDTHRGEKRYRCGGCGFRFARADAMVRHVRAKGCVVEGTKKGHEGDEEF